MVSYAYLHCKPDGTPFYVGKGSLRRANYLGERNSHHKATVNKYGAEAVLIGVMACTTDSIAFELERGVIKCLRRMGVKLTNRTDGGEGGLNPSLNTRKKLSVAAKARGVSLECQQARSRAKLGVPLSTEHKAKLSTSMLGRTFTPSHKANIAKSARLRGMPEQTLAAAHKATRGRTQSIEERAARAKAISSALVAANKTTRVVVGGVLYESLASAAKALATSSSAVLQALRRKGTVKGKKVERAL